MGVVHALVGGYVASRATEPFGRDQIPQAPDDDSVVGFATEALEQLVEALAGIEPETPVWNWSPRPDAGFYFRRMLHETSVHRWDAENGLGVTGPVDGDQGRDGVDEYFEFVIPNALKRRRSQLTGAERPSRTLPTGSLHLHRTDGDGEWLVRDADGEVAMERIHAKGDAAVRGPGGALFLAMWNRLPLSDPTLSVVGDETVAAAWASLAP